MPYTLLFPLWTGIILLLKKDWDLKSRIEAYLGKAADSKLFESFSGLKGKIEKELLEEELSEALSYIHNLVVLGRGGNMSAELLLSELADMSKRLSQVFLSMAASMNVNDKRKAEETFTALFDGYARDTVSLFTGWEDIPPEDLLSTVETFRSALREERLTRKKRRDETVSDLIYFPVVLNCMVILLNFIYVGFFIEQKEILMTLLG